MTETPLTDTPKTFKIDPAIAQELAETAKREGRHQVTIVEWALQDYFAKSKAAQTPPEQEPA